MIFIKTTTFTRQAAELLSDDELWALQIHLLEHPDAGAVIPGGSGLRKLRWGAKGRGKRGGVRVIYFRVVARGHIHLMLLYAKNSQEDLTPEQVRILKAVLEGELA